jgi:hypothetical protein
MFTSKTRPLLDDARVLGDGIVLHFLEYHQHHDDMSNQPRRCIDRRVTYSMNR